MYGMLPTTGFSNLIYAGVGLVALGVGFVVKRLGKRVDRDNGSGWDDVFGGDQ